MFQTTNQTFILAIRQYLDFAFGAAICPKATEFHARVQSAVLFRRVFFANSEHTKYRFSLHFIAFLRFPKTVPNYLLQLYL
jgi:hypothetical protein